VSLIDNEDFRHKVLKWVRTSNKCKHGVDVGDFRTRCNEVLLPEFDRTVSGCRVTISHNTSHTWLSLCGLVEDNQKIGVFFDGHERNDVVCSRYSFLDAFAPVQARMAHFEGPDLIRVEPILAYTRLYSLLVREKPCALLTTRASTMEMIYTVSAAS
jgi:hypothetical protein